MIQFKEFSRSSVLLKEDGFQVFDRIESTEIYHKLLDLKPNLEVFSKSCKPGDVFRTKLGDVKQIQNLHKYIPEDVAPLNTHLANLIGAKDYTILNNQYFCKPPNYKMTSAHQDNAYFDSNDNVVTFWVPFSEVDILNSCMFYVPGSHLNGLVEHKPIGTNVRTRTDKTGVSMYSDVYKNSDFVKVPMNLGDVLVHDKNTMHFSSPNLSDNYRIAITCIMKINEYFPLDLDKLVGMYITEASKICRNKGYTIRITNQHDTENFSINMDFKDNRVNFAINDGRVSKIYIG